MSLNEKTKHQGIVVAGLGGGSGKSVVAVGLAAAYARQGHTVVPFKKGPDYIDAGWLALAAGQPCYNLDPYLMTSDALRKSFARHAGRGEIVIVEGNRGLFDGVSAQGQYSTAELAKMLRIPVLLVVDCTKTTRTVAALVLGCKTLDPDVDIRGVVLNRVGTARQEGIVREAVEKYAGIPVLGAVHRSKHDVFPQRHLGITPAPEHGGVESAVAALAVRAEQSLDLERIAAVMSGIETMAVDDGPQGKEMGVRIGYLRDAAFQFYYAENLAALEQAGARLVPVNALSEKELPEVDGLYIGGGFPETSARDLAANVSFRQSVKAAAENGLPIYAECGGLIYLGEGITLEGREFPLAGIFPMRFTLERKPQAHGYTVLTVEGDNPFYPPGTEIKGHEFRYSKVAEWRGQARQLALKMERGQGFMGGRDGLTHKNVLALYTHIHAVGMPGWAPAFVKQARRYRETR